MFRRHNLQETLTNSQKNQSTVNSSFTDSSFVINPRNRSKSLTQEGNDPPFSYSHSSNVIHPRNRSKSQRQEGNNPSSSFTNSSHTIHSENHLNSQTQEQDDNHSLVSSFSGISSDDTDADPEYTPSTTGGDDDDEDDGDSEMETDMHIKMKRELTEDPVYRYSKRDDNVVSEVATDNRKSEHKQKEIEKGKEATKSKSSRDKHFCLYCETEVNNFARHLIRWHKNETDVQQIMSKEKNSVERKRLINLIRNKGNFLLNSEGKCEKPVKKKQNSTSELDYLPCTYCYGFFSRKLLWRHKKKCPQNYSNEKSNQANSQNFLIKNIKIDQQLMLQVFPHMRADHISLVVKCDLLICAFGARYLKTHREKHFISVTSRKMRELAKLLIELKKLQPKIKNLFDALQPEYYDLLTQATKIVARYSEEKECFGAPTYAMNIATSLKDCCNIAITYALRRKHVYSTLPAAEAESKLKTLIHLIQSNWQYDISTVAANDLNSKKWNKVTIVPLATDIKILKNYLEKKGEKEASKLNSNNTDVDSYRGLLETVFCRVLLLNRKRPGELQRMLLSTYINAEKRQSYEEFSEVVSATEKVLMKRFKRVVIRGKRGRGVPVLFSTETQSHIDLLLKNRKNFFQDEENPYLFGLPGRKTTIIGYKVLDKIAKNSGLKYPEAISSTRLRKHLATITQLFNMNDNDIEQLATFMGHTERVHRGEYRLPDDVYQTAKLCKILLAMESGSAAQWKGKSLDEIEMNFDENLLNEELEVEGQEERGQENSFLHFQEDDDLEINSAENKTNTIIQNSDKKQRRVLEPWTEKQKQFTKDFFMEHIKNKQPPKKHECEQLKCKYPNVFANKSWLKIKVFVQNIYKKM